MTKQEKLDFIYEAMADKTLSDGCKVLCRDGYVRVIGDDTLSGDDIAYGEYEIIGHPVRIGDVLEYCNNELIPKGEHSLYFYISSIIDYWENKRLPIDEQSEGCVSFVYSLIQK